MRANRYAADPASSRTTRPCSGCKGGDVSAGAVHIHCCVIDGVFAAGEDGQVHIGYNVSRSGERVACVAPARGLPLWNQTAEPVADWGDCSAPVPEFVFDQPLDQGSPAHHPRAACRAFRIGSTATWLAPPALADPSARRCPSAAHYSRALPKRFLNSPQANPTPRLELSRPT